MCICRKQREDDKNHSSMKRKKTTVKDTHNLSEETIHRRDRWHECSSKEVAGSLVKGRWHFSDESAGRCHRSCDKIPPTPYLHGLCSRAFMFMHTHIYMKPKQGKVNDFWREASNHWSEVIEVKNIKRELSHIISYIFRCPNVLCSCNFKDE